MFCSSFLNVLVWYTAFIFTILYFIQQYNNYNFSRLIPQTSNQDLQLYNTINWFNEVGEVAAIHHMNPVRATYIQSLLSTQSELTRDVRRSTTRIIANEVHDSQNCEHCNTEEMNIEKPLRVLDLGCGSGILIFELLRRIGDQRIDFVGVDIARGAIDQANSKKLEIMKGYIRDYKKIESQLERFMQSNSNTSEGTSNFKELIKRRDILGTVLRNLENATFRQSSIISLKKESEFDVVIASNVLNYIENLPKAVTIISKVLKRSGILYYDNISRTISSWIVTYALQVLKWIPRNSFDWKMFITPIEMSQLLLENKFNVEEVKSMLPRLTLKSFITFLQESYQKSYVSKIDFEIANKLPDSIEFMYLGHARKN